YKRCRRYCKRSGNNRRRWPYGGGRRSVRFVEFYIRQFGLLREVGGSFSPGLSLIVGENESGKTTLMNFFRYCLFNFPHGRSNRNFYLPPDGRAQQGQLIVETTNGVSL